MREKIDSILNQRMDESLVDFYIPGHSTNDVYIVETEDKSYCIKISNGKYTSAFRSEPYIQERVRRETKIPTPEILEVDFTHNIIGKDYFIMEFSEGVNARKENISDKSLTNEIEKYAEELSKVNFEEFGYFAEESESIDIFPSYGSWSDILENEVKIMSNYMMSNRFRYLSEYHVKKFQEYKYILENYDFEPSLVNSDIRPANILLKEDNVNDILDWGSCFCGENFYTLKKMEFLMNTPGNEIEYKISEEKVKDEKLDKFYNFIMWMYIMGGFNKWYSNVSEEQKNVYEAFIRKNYKKSARELEKI
jgi:aminoglycoside phosphotransferase (APT) family kinase protein